MKELAGRRKAYASKGDDCTLTRWVKTGTARTRKYQPLLIESKRTVFPHIHMKPAIQAGRSIFHRKGIKTVEALPNLLVTGHSNVKIGRDVRVGLFRGYWIYTLSFEERATCPSTCHHWETCYGNNMPYSKRVDHTDLRALTAKLEAEIHELLNKRYSGGRNGTFEGRKGVLIRLHALGDFFSVKYVHFWLQMLAAHPKLAIYGYTAHAPDSPIGREISLVKNLYGRRFAIRWSNGGTERDSTVPVQHGIESVPGAFICPEQMNLENSKGVPIICATCALCWTTDKNVAFMEH